MYVVKGLFDFVTDVTDVTPMGDCGETKSASEPTCVVAEVAQVHKREEIGVASVAQVYLTSELGYRNFCENCNMLLMIQATDSNFVPLRIFCGTEKCVK